MTNTVFDLKMVHKLTWYSHNGKTANLIDYDIVNQGLQDPYKILENVEVLFMLKMLKKNLKLKFRKGSYLLRSYNAGRPRDRSFRESLKEQLNRPGILKFEYVED